MCCEEWSLKNISLVCESPLANLYQVELVSGDLAALKLFTPLGIKDEWAGVLLLSWYGGKGAVEVLEAKDGALLMPWLTGGSLMMLCDDGRVEEAAMTIADLSVLVREQGAPAPQLPSIETRFDALFEFCETRIPNDNLVTFHLAKDVAASMLAQVEERVPLHGDLHFRNVLFDGAQWRLIDPKGLIGPPAYDLANLFINPWDRPNIVLADGRAERLAIMLANKTGYDASEYIGWAIAHAAIAAVWHISNGGTGRHPLYALDSLFKVKDKLP